LAFIKVRATRQEAAWARGERHRVVWFGDLSGETHHSFYEFWKWCTFGDMQSADATSRRRCCGRSSWPCAGVAVWGCVALPWPPCSRPGLCQRFTGGPRPGWRHCAVPDLPTGGPEIGIRSATQQDQEFTMLQAKN